MSFVSPAEYLSLRLRAHELLQDVRLHDVSVVDLPNGGDGRSLADLRALHSTAPPSRIATILFGVRRLLGRIFRWDRGPFVVVYQSPNEALYEIVNKTVHGYVSTALIRTAAGYRLYVAVYVRPVSWLTRPYLMAIEPFRHILYPALSRRIRRAWAAAYVTSPG
ncbi:MAG TPA: DUF2867 domain-containing protein [Thermoanaerobaculia bacterium]|nr:DUF2867 domain-containing protein [Thermoanaerobaculia bacterium]